MAGRRFSTETALDGLYDGLFVFIGFLVALEVNKYLSTLSFLQNKLVAGLVWLVLGFVVTMFWGANKYVLHLGAGFYVYGFYDIVSNYITL